MIHNSDYVPSTGNRDVGSSRLVGHLSMMSSLLLFFLFSFFDCFRKNLEPIRLSFFVLLVPIQCTSYMWAFEKFVPTPTIIPDTTIMSMRNGLEARYADRFTKYAGTTDDYLKKADQARQVSDNLRTAVGVVDTQKENIDQLFLTAETMVKMIDNFQRASGSKQVQNIPLPGESIKSSYGRKLGYVELSMKFISAGMLHFMETALEMKDDIKAKEAVIKAISDERMDVPIIGSITDISFDDLSNDGPIVETKIALDTDSDNDSNPSLSDKASTAASTPSVTPLKAPVTPEKRPMTPGKQVTPTPTGRATPLSSRPAPKK